MITPFLYPLYIREIPHVRGFWCVFLYILAIVKQIPFETPSEPNLAPVAIGYTRTGDSTSTGTTSTGGTASSGPAVAGYTGGQLQLDRDRM